MDCTFMNARFPDGSLRSLIVSGGKFAAISGDGENLAEGPPATDLGGGLVIPGLVEGHIHLDKSFLGDRWRPHRPCTAGFDVHERVKFEKAFLATAAPVSERGATLIRAAIARGTTHMRSHVDIDPGVGLKNLEAVLDLRERFKEEVSIQVVAFPQSGIVTAPGASDLLDAAVRAGADLIGGLDPAGFDRDVKGHLDVVFGIAERRGVPVDVHLHDPDALGVAELEDIAERTRALGMQGRVAVSHAYCLGQVPDTVLRKTAATLADAGVAIMTNAPGNHAFPPVLPLRAAGVLVFAGNDNIRDSWWPYGDADMLERAMIVGYRSGFYTDEDLKAAFDLVTGAAARALGLKDHGLEVGRSADFVVLDADHVPESVVARPSRKASYKRGKLVARDGQYRGRNGTG